MSETKSLFNRDSLTIGSVWVAVLIGTLLVALLVEPARQLTWLTVVLLGALFLTVALQLVLQETDGFLRRMSLSLVGAFVILVVASIVFALTGAGWSIGGHGVPFVGG